MATLPMFPLGAVLFPHMPLHLQVFEPRYAVMLTEMLHSKSAEFGVVLIERGQEVGGGEHRFRVGTVAEIADLKADDGVLRLAARGTRRIEVREWLPDDPYPRADVVEFPGLAWSEELEPRRVLAEQLVRRTLALASEFAELRWPVDVELSTDPLAAVWQLAGIAPLSPLDQVALLRATSVEQLLRDLVEQTAQVQATITASWPDDPP